jgi:hypothetical protein
VIGRERERDRESLGSTYWDIIATIHTYIEGEGKRDDVIKREKVTEETLRKRKRVPCCRYAMSAPAMN